MSGVSFLNWLDQNKWKLNFVVLIFTILIVGGAFAIWSRWELPLTSPISPQTRFRFTLGSWLRQPTAQPPVVYGFLPYWNLKSAQINPNLTHLSYFSLTVGPDGSLETTGDDESLAGYRGLQSDRFLEIIEIMEKEEINLELVLKQFSNDDAVKFLHDQKAQENLYSQLSSLLLAYPVAGINLDFELTKLWPDAQPQFTLFVQNLKKYLIKHHPNAKLSVDVYASAAQGQNLWNIAALEPWTDWFVVMAYDFHQRGSPQAGPVAPLIGTQAGSHNNINANLKEFLEQVPPTKILLGIPFYGYEWQTDSRNQSANTYPDTGRTATYERVQDVLSQKRALQVKESWNDVALVPYLSYEKDGQTYIIYYENQRSLEYKIDYVNQLNLAGIAIWALGYEGDNQDLWTVIEQKL